MMMTSSAKSFLVPAELTSDQIDAFCREWNLHAPDVRRFATTLFRVAGTSVEVSGLETVRWIDVPLVRRPDAEALLAAKDAQLAELASALTAANIAVECLTIERDRIATRALPAEMTPEIADVLGRPNFWCSPLAHAFQAAGYQIKRRAEDEQAFILFWLLGLVLEHGKDWRPHAGEQLQAIRSAGGQG